MRGRGGVAEEIGRGEEKCGIGVEVWSGGVVGGGGGPSS